MKRCLLTTVLPVKILQSSLLMTNTVKMKEVV
ncbi:hypothetical protein ES703_58180 [subsurface metagenome]